MWFRRSITKEIEELQNKNEKLERELIKAKEKYNEEMYKERQRINKLLIHIEEQFDEYIEKIQKELAVVANRKSKTMNVLNYDKQDVSSLMIEEFERIEIPSFNIFYIKGYRELEDK